jgi:hypothetical protein
MQHNILWSGIENSSLENCIIENNATGIFIRSTIIGSYQQEIYEVAYTLQLDKSWHTQSCSIRCQHNNEIRGVELEKTVAGWILNGETKPEFDACIDVDIRLTPFTNSLPINRLKLKIGQKQEIDVIYIDILSNSVKNVQQRYQCTAANQYRYENMANHFEAEIQVDDLGLIIDYPQLFKRQIKSESNY